MRKRNGLRIVGLGLLVALLVGCDVVSPEGSTTSEAPPPSDTPVPPTTAPTPTREPQSSPLPTDIPPTLTPEVPAYHVVLVPSAGLRIQVPQSWAADQLGSEWVQPDGQGRIGVKWTTLTPPAEPEAALLPENAQVLESAPAETPLGSGRSFRLEAYGALSERSDVQPQVVAVELHVLVVTSEAGQRIAYDLYASAPTAEGLDMVLPVFSEMVNTVQPAGDDGAQPSDDYADTPAAAFARTRLAEHLSVEEASVTIVSVEAVDWSDACLGIREPGQMCAQVITPGYRIVAEVDGRNYELHTNATGSVVGIVP